MATQASLNFVQQLYVAYYGRPADSAGLQYWADRVEEEDQGFVVRSFGNSAEFQEDFGSLTNIQLVNNLYQQLFSRDAEPAGLNYYVGVLERGEKSLAEIAVTIKNAAAGTDKDAFEAKVAVAAEYTAENGGETYDVEDAKALVEGAGDTAVITEALENLQSANDAKAEFLATAASNELVQAELSDGDTNADAADPENPTPTEVEAAIVQAETEISGELSTARAANSDRVLDANLADAQEAVSDYEAEIAKVEGLEAAIAAKSAATDQVTAAADTQTEANANLVGAVATFGELNGGFTAPLVYLQDDGTTAWDPANDPISDLASIEDSTTTPLELFTVTDGELSAAADAEDLNGVSALQAALQAKVDAEAEVDAAAAADSAADTGLANITLTADEEAALGETSAADVYGQLNTLEGNVTTAQTAVDERAELVADDAAISELADELESANQDITEATEALTDSEADGGLDVTLTDFGGAATAGDDLFVFSADADGTSTSQFGVSGDDKIYIGEDFARVDLEADAVFTDEQGDADSLEIFFQQSGNDAVLNFENKAFAGSGSTDADLTTVTLTGVNVENLSIEDGYITIA